MVSGGNVIAMKGLRELPRSAPKSLRSTMDTVLLTQDWVKSMAHVPFQRPIRVNARVVELAEELKCAGGVIPGILTIGVIGKERYLVDGQHRVEAFKMSGLKEGYADVRICHFDSMAEMGEEFVNLNSQLVRMRPDDILRGLEGSNAGLGVIRKACDFVGYDMIRRGASSPLLSMSTLLRCWFGSAPDVPTSSGMSALHAARTLTEDDSQQIVQFLNVAHGGFGRDPEYYRLWSSLNLTVCAWLWRRTVLTQYSPKSARMTAMLFGKCLMALSADHGYLDWLVGRNLSDRDRSPCYNRIKAIFVKRLEEETGKKPIFPAPAWASHGGNR